jgi:hypothetical protein
MPHLNKLKVVPMMADIEGDVAALAVLMMGGVGDD